MKQSLRRWTSYMSKKLKKIKAVVYRVSVWLMPHKFIPNYQSVNFRINSILARELGPRCKTKDHENFPWLDNDLITIGNPDVGRCRRCLIYEKFDEFWEFFNDNKKC